MIEINSAFQLIEKHCDFALQRHLAHVATAMKVLARHLGYENEQERWYLAGLLHDLDWNQTINNPEKHCGHETVALLKANGVDEEICDVIRSHYDFTQVSRDTDFKKALFAVDELSGFCVAVALLRPTKMIGMSSKSVTKKMKDKAFAAAVSREDMMSCKEYFNLEISELLALLIPAFEKIAPEWKLV